MICGSLATMHDNKLFWPISDENALEHLKCLRLVIVAHSCSAKLFLAVIVTFVKKKVISGHFRASFFFRYHFFAQNEHFCCC